MRGRRARAACLAFVFAWVGIADFAAADKWQHRLRRLESKLDAADWKSALDESIELRRKVIARVSEAQRLLPVAAQTLALQAIAEINLGREADARWHWLAAQSYLDHLADLDLSAYGQASSLLAGLSAEEIEADWITPAPPEDAKDRYKEVKIRQPVEPVFPKALRKSAIEGKVAVEIVVDAQGRPRRPRVLDAGLVPTMAFPVLDALQRWQFKAASRDGEPIAVLYQIRIDYR